MKQNIKYSLAAIIALSGVLANSMVCAQTVEAKEKPPMYTRVSQWQIPRSEWPNLKADPAETALYQKLIKDGVLVGFGHEVRIDHTDGGYTHDDWMTSMSLAGLVKANQALDAIPEPSVYTKTTKHADYTMVSYYYNQRSGDVKDGIDFTRCIELKPEVNVAEIDHLSKTYWAPMLEREFAAGLIVEYDISTNYLQTDSGQGVCINWIAKNAEALDKTEQMLDAWQKANPLIREAVMSYRDSTKTRDFLSTENATLK
jgi:hypothetical protein